MLAFMQLVQTLSFLGVPLMTALTVWMLGVQRRLVRRWEWLIDFPNCGLLPQTSQTLDIAEVSHTRSKRELASISPKREDFG